ncbi:hypothetical protein AB4Y42_42820 [Paraburkholderia sp. EG286B]|uniref:hypothetical protein n=1 Tax=unclassified Paraburkholderia TaxID=2615204 RepID=UPI0034D2F808
MENPATDANERARCCFADRPVARASGRTSSFSPKELHAHLRKGVGVHDVREHEIGVLPAVHFGLFMRGRRRDPGDGSIFSALFLGSPMKLNSARMLEIMESSREYMAGELAWRFDTSMAQINDMLCTFAEEGLVRMSCHSSRIVRLQRLSFVPQPPNPLVSDMATRAAVSTPPFARQMHGWSRNCEASLLGVHSFAMPVRPSR